MDRNESERSESDTRNTFMAAPPSSARETGSVRGTFGSFGSYVAARTHVFGPTTSTSRQDSQALALLIVLAIGLAVVPEVITHLNVKPMPDLPPLEDDSASTKFPLAHLASLAGSAVLLVVSSMIAVKR